MDRLLSLKKRLNKINKELDSVRSSSFIDGWQTSRHAKKSRKWDELAKEKFKIKNEIEDLELKIRHNEKQKQSNRTNISR